MCFTVAIVRNNTLMTVEQYYSSLDLKKPNKLPNFPDYYFVSGFTHPQLPVVTNDGFFLYEWGLIPSWSKNLEKAIEIQDKTLNAMGETVFEKPSFKKCIDNQRCIIPVTGFFEWHTLNERKYPYFIKPLENEFFNLGGIYDSWMDLNTGEIKNTFCIITTVANPLMEKIHNTKKRMPLILKREDEDKWINSNLTTEAIKELIKPFPECEMNAYTITRMANNVRNNRNTPEILDPVFYSELNDQTLF